MDAETGFYYYGARYLDPKTSRWISADPALGEYVPGAGKGGGDLPGMGGVFNTVNLHTYHYAGNNPVKYTDPDGKFSIKIHSDMVKDVVSRSNLPEFAANRIIAGASWIADIIFMPFSSVHMDSMQKGTKTIIDAYSNAVENFSTHMQKGNYIRAGKALHTIADFYSHSNYIELYKKYAKNNGKSMDITTIPTFSDAMKDTDLLNFIEKEGGLKTGTFTILDLLTVDHWSSWRKNPESHALMNLDKKSGKGAEAYNNNGDTMHDAARETAQKEIKRLME